MKQKVLASGAEAIILKKGKLVQKRRIKKGYRYPVLDEKIRKLRTRQEARLLEKVNKHIASPKMVKVNELDKEIDMEYIPGKKLSHILDKSSNKKEIAHQIGINLAIIHDNTIMHGDLTTANMIWYKEKVYFLDFGLGFHSTRIEDRAVDFHLLYESLKAKHSKIALEVFTEVLKSYKKSKEASKTIAQLKKVEKRGRYKPNY